MLPTPRTASLAALTAAALLAPASAALAADASLDTTERWMLGQLNVARAEAGVAPLEASGALQRAADGYARHLDAHPGQTGHEADGRTVGERLAAAGWPGTDGYAEDVFTSRTEGAQDALDAWMASPAHRANILDGTLRAVGVARAGRSWVLDFARACPAGQAAGCEMTGDRGDATLAVDTSALTSTTTSSGTGTTAPPTGTAAAPTAAGTTPAGAPVTGTTGTATGTTGTGTGTTGASGTAGAGAAGTTGATGTPVPLQVSSVRTRGQVISVTVAVARERRRAVRVTASRAGRTVVLRLARTRGLPGGRVARTYARKLPTGTWRIHAQLRRVAAA